MKNDFKLLMVVIISVSLLGVALLLALNSINKTGNLKRIILSMICALLSLGIAAFYGYMAHH